MTQEILILSIDDSKSVHAYLDRSLKDSEYKLIHAMGGIEGMEILKNAKLPIKLVLLDWEMPEVTGPEVLKQIRSTGNNIPIVMLTTKNEPSEILTLLENGANEYIMKPFTPEILLDKLSIVLSGFN